MRVTFSRCGRAAVVLLLCGAAGCGPALYPVHGKVTLEDGTPVSGGMVVFEKQEGGKTVMARGEIGADGSYQLSTYRPGDGAPPGHYRVLVSPKFDPTAIDNPQAANSLPFDARYSEFGTSGLEYEVKPGTNEFPIPVKRAKSRR